MKSEEIEDLKLKPGELIMVFLTEELGAWETGKFLKVFQQKYMRIQTKGISGCGEYNHKTFHIDDIEKITKLTEVK